MLGSAKKESNVSMKKAERIEGNKLYLKNCGFEYSEEYNAYYRTYGTNSKPIYITERNLDMPVKEFDALVEKLRIDAIKFRNITVDDLQELDKTMEKINRIVKEQEQQKEHPDKIYEQSIGISVQDMSVEALNNLKAEIEKALKEKGAKRKRKTKEIDKRKPSLRVRKSIYLEMYYRDMDGKLICKYVGKIGDQATEKRIDELGKPELSQEYRQLKIKWENEHTQINLFT